ncbi:MAG TPA: energy transducer TonB [Steroidobacteraceae bacterium]|nr:energy transducer TonB [Steroidobacteraceae bacterium]
MALHVALIYALCIWQPIRTVFHEVPIEASIIDAPFVAPQEAPPPPPQMMSVHVPAIEPPLISIAEEPAPNAITVAHVEQRPAPAPQPATTATPHEITDVAYIQPPAPKYPPESRRTGEEGLVVLRVLINEAGRAAQIEVERSSGYARLDAAARAAVERALFRPYVENGVARVATARIPIEFTWKSRAADRAGRS